MGFLQLIEILLKRNVEKCNVKSQELQFFKQVKCVTTVVQEAFLLRGQVDWKMKKVCILGMTKLFKNTTVKQLAWGLEDPL